MSESSSEPNLFDRLAHEFAERERRGEHPALTEYTDKYPELADDIRDLFPALMVMEQFGSAAGPVTGPYGSQPDKSVPPQLGEYRILREVARGGMGIVYEAVQESLGRHVALKVLPAHALMSPTHLERFRREARAAAKLHHTNIVPVFGVGEDPGVHYYAMQFIQGQGLDSVLRELRRLRRSPKAAANRADEPESSAEEHNCRMDLSASLAGGLLTGQFQRTVDPDPNLRDCVPRDAFAIGPPNETALQGVPANQPGLQSHPLSSDSGTMAATLTGRSEATAPSDHQFFQSVARVGVQIADALVYAHGQGVLHRDIKPSNLLLDLQGTVWIADFGLAKMEETGELTNPGDIVGTLRYMAPERFQGKADSRSDVFSLGLTLYELATLKPGFSDTDRAKLIEKMLHEEPPRPRRHDPHVPRDLETIILKAIAKDPQHRYATAGELAEDLRRFVADRPIRARRTAWPERLYRWGRRNPLVAGLLFFIAVLLVAGAGVSSYFAFEADARAKEAGYNAEQAEKQAGIAQTNENIAKRNETTARANETRANDNAAEANKQKTIAQDNERLARQRYYAAQMNLAAQAWDNGQPARLLELLEDVRPKFDEEDIRTFEWYCLWQLGRRHHRFTLRGHSNIVHPLAFSPDGSTLATGDHDGIVKLWDLTNGKEQASFQADTGRLWGIAFSGDGKTLATAGDERLLKLWDVSSRRQKTAFPAPDRLRWVAFSPDDKTLLYSAMGGENPKMLDIATGTEPAKLPGRPDGEGVLAAAFSHDGKTIAAGYCEGQRVKLWAWDGAAWKEKATIQGEGEMPLAFSPDGSLIVLGGTSVRLWDVAAGKEKATLRGQMSEVWSVAFAPDGKSVAAAGNDRTVRVWDIATGREKVLGAHKATVWSIKFSPDSRLIATASEDATAIIWQLGDEPDPDTLAMKNKVAAMALSPDHQFLAAQTAEGAIKLWDLNTRMESATLQQAVEAKNQEDSVNLHGVHPVQILTYSSDSKLLVSCVGHVPTLWNVATRKVQAVLPKQRDAISALALAPDGRTLAIGTVPWSDIGELKLWEVSRKQVRAVLTSHQLGPPWALAFSPNGKILAGGGHFEWQRLWDTDTGKDKGVFSGGKDVGNSTTALAFSTDGQMLAEGILGGIVRIWNANTGQLRASLRGHTDIIKSVCFFPDGKTLATGSQDQTVRLWDVATGQERCTLRGNKAAVLLVSVSQDGQTLVTGSTDGTVKRWRAATDAEARAHKTELDPNDPNAPATQLSSADRLWADGQTQLAEQAYRKARARLEKLTGHFTEDPVYRLELARALESLGLLQADTDRPHEAEQSHRQSLECASKLSAQQRQTVARTLSALGQVLEKAGRRQGAEKVYGRAIELKPDDYDVWFKRAMAFARWNEDEKALADYDEVIKLNPASSSAWNNRGNCQQQLGRLNKALEDYSKAGELDPGSPITWCNRGKTYEILRQWDKAIADYSRAIELNPGHTHALTNRARLYEQLNQWDKLIAQCTKILESKPEDHATWNLRGVAYSRLGQWIKALENQSKAADLKADVPLYWLNCGIAKARLGRSEQAKTDFDKAAELAGSNAGAWSALGEAYWGLHMRDDAIGAYSKAIEYEPGAALRWATRGHAYAEMGRWKNAEEDYAKTVQLAPGMILAWYRLALLRLHQADTAGYRQTCAQMLERFAATKNNSDADMLAWTCILGPGSVPDPARPVHLVERIAASVPKNYTVISTLGAALFRAGRFEEAVKRLDEAVAASKSTELVQMSVVYNWLFLAMAHYRLGHAEESRQWLEKAIREIDRATSGKPEVAAGNTWNRRVTFLILRREAEAMLDEREK
jgi:WD40 repeat protein/serine/threonine protein kinase/tetratricopeptide (TPR) repeat protein